MVELDSIHKNTSMTESDKSAAVDNLVKRVESGDPSFQKTVRSVREADQVVQQLLEFTNKTTSSEFARGIDDSTTELFRDAAMKIAS